MKTLKTYISVPQPRVLLEPLRDVLLLLWGQVHSWGLGSPPLLLCHRHL